MVGSEDRRFRNTLPQRLIRVEPLQESRQRLRVIRIMKNEGVYLIGEELGDSRKDGCDDRKATGYRFQNGQAKGILAAWTHIEISGRVKVNDIAPRWFAVEAPGNIQAPRHFTERPGVIGACDKEMQRKSGEGGDGSEDGGNAFHGPVVSQQQQDKIGAAEIAGSPSLSAARQTQRRRKLCGIDAVRNYTSVVTLEIAGEEISRAPRNAR